MTEAQKRRLAAIVQRQKFIIAQWATPKLRRALGTIAKNVETGYTQGGLDRALAIVDEFLPEIQQVLLEIYNRSGEVFGERTIASLETFAGITVNATVAEASLGSVAQRFQRVAFTQSKLINETTKKLLREEAKRLVDAGEPETVIGRKLRQHQDDLSVARSQMIARTEVHMIAEETQAELIKELPLPPMVKEWNASLDRRTRKDHRRVDGQQRPLDGLFDVGGEKMRHPGDRRASARNVCNCRCITLVIPADEAEPVGDRFDPNAAPLTPGGFEGESDFGADA